MEKTIIGVFQDTTHANQALEDLKSKAYDVSKVSIVMKDKDKKDEMPAAKGDQIATGAVDGAATGGVIGAVAGLLIGLGAIAIPGIGGLLVGGPLVAALGLTGAAATTATGAMTGALAGGLIGALVNLGVSHDEAEQYQKSVEQGRILLLVPVNEVSIDFVRSIFENHSVNQMKVLEGVHHTV